MVRILLAWPTPARGKRNRCNFGCRADTWPQFHSKSIVIEPVKELFSFSDFMKNLWLCLKDHDEILQAADVMIIVQAKCNKPKPDKTATKMSLRNTVGRWKERRVSMQPKAGIAKPQGNGKPAKEVFGGGGGVTRAGTMAAIIIRST